MLVGLGPRIPYKDFIDRLDRRVSIITGLEFSIDEPTQVANYGIGGHFNPHTVMVFGPSALVIFLVRSPTSVRVRYLVRVTMLKDVIEYEQNKRIATWLGYLSGRVQRTGSGWIYDKAVRVTESLSDGPAYLPSAELWLQMSKKAEEQHSLQRM